MQMKPRVLTSNIIIIRSKVNLADVGQVQIKENLLCDKEDDTNQVIELV